MTIWVDADAAPRAVKEMLYRAATRTETDLVLVANKAMLVPRSRFIRMLVVSHGFDVADEHILEQVRPGDLVITQDVPLAAAVVERGAECIDVRGQVIDVNNARARLAMRDLREEQRHAGEMIGGPKAFGDRDKHRFAAALDRWLARSRKP